MEHKIITIKKINTCKRLNHMGIFPEVKVILKIHKKSLFMALVKNQFFFITMQ
jgi:hypothetical protein